MTYPNPPGQYPPYPQQPGYGHPQQPGQAYPQFPQQQPYGYGQQGYGQDPYAAVQQRPPLAGWGSRVGASLVDGLICAVLPLALMSAGLFMMLFAYSDCSSYEDSRGYCEQSTGTMYGGAALMLIGVLTALVLQLWTLYRQGKTGQTPGKKALGISVLRERDGMPTGFGMAFVRQLCHFFDGFLYLGYLWPLWDEKKQTFADKMVGTVVVRTR
ncbi:RDD family protein [Streptomyces sp. NPDC026206]|uniref:RDD family protein n=1 Tax=Streptomyces sp. NPDC026206 TaxID=3157089 RepID=UPI0034011B96